VKRLRVPFLGKLDDLFLGEMMLSDLLNFTQNEILKVFHFRHDLPDALVDVQS
jgi:hypothetical protein